MGRREPSSAYETLVPADGDLPEYTRRVSSRAKHVRLKVTPRDGIVVVIPESMPGFDPAEVLRSHAEWLADATAHYAEHRASLLQPAEDKIPVSIDFALTGEHWDVACDSSGDGRGRVTDSGGRLVVRGADADAEVAIAALQRWLHRAARRRLVPMIEALAAEVGTRLVDVSVRAQRARWGGCSSRGAISLNRGLVFLEPELARAVMLHEIAHLRHPNHSKAFWAELAKLDPEWERHRAEIAGARSVIPAWAEP